MECTGRLIIASVLRVIDAIKIAIAKFFDGEGPDPVAEALAAQSIPRPRSSHQETLAHTLFNESLQGTARRMDTAPRIVPQPIDTISYRPPYILGLILSPLSFLYGLATKALAIFGSLFPFMPTILNFSTASSMSRKQLKPTDAAIRLRRSIEEEYSVQTSTLPVMQDSYAAALDMAKRDLKFLLVIILSPEHDSHHEFMQETLLSPRLRTLVLDSSRNTVLWAGDVRDSEAYQVSEALRCTAFPFTALVGHTGQGSGGMTVLARLTGVMPMDVWMEKLERTMSQHRSRLDEARQERQARDLDRRMREEQDGAYERSLAIDRERARQQKEAAAKAKEAEKNKARAEAQRADFEAKSRQWRHWRALDIPSEPGEKEPDVVRVRIALPEHGRIMRRFRGTESLETMYAFVDCYAELERAAVDEKTTGPPVGYEHRYDFRLVSTLPRVVYEPDKDQSIGEKVGRSGNLIVEALGDDEGVEN